MCVVAVVVSIGISVISVFVQMNDMNTWEKKQNMNTWPTNISQVPKQNKFLFSEKHE